MTHTTNWLLAALLAALMSTAHLLDGPSEIESMQDVADDLQDAIKSVAINDVNTRDSGQKNYKTIVAGVYQ